MMSDHSFENGLYGYTGKILTIDLTSRTTGIIPTTKYVPRYIGGEAVAIKYFWDEVPPGVSAYDPRNPLIFMTGAPCGTGMPASNRLSVCGISPNSLPEQFTHSNMGGFFSGMMKYAGYDGIIVTGKADRHTYVYINDGDIQFLDADGFIWGEYVHETQDKLYEKYGKNAHSVVIGPAGENLHRNASITTSNDSASAKAGFGAVMGAKNLKAIVVKGSGTVPVADPKKVIELHKSVGYPVKAPNPLETKEQFFFVKPEGGWKNARLCCGYGCNVVCMNTHFNMPDPLHPGQTTAEVIKCVGINAVNFTKDAPHGIWNNIHSKQNENPRDAVYDQMKPLSDPNKEYPPGAFTGSYQYNKLRVNDPTDEKFRQILVPNKIDNLNYFGSSYERGVLLNVLCTQYGLDKWDLSVWYFSWLAMAQQEGLLDDLDFGMKVDMDNMDFVRHFIDMMTYRQGLLGNIFAEGMARAMRILGKEKYADAPYHNRYDETGKVQLALPCSLEAGWGHSTHYSGRGMQGNVKFFWVIYQMNFMTDSRDPICNHHLHDDIENYLKYKDDPCHSPVLAKTVAQNDIYGMLKDSLVTCEWKSPNPGWMGMEAEMYNAVTGLNVTEQDLYDSCAETLLLYRAILMRNFGRCRDMEVNEIFPYMTYPDPYGEVVTWDEWNDAVDLYYKEVGYDLETGWPTRSTWEKYGLSDVADQMEAIGLLPPEGRDSYVRKPQQRRP